MKLCGSPCILLAITLPLGVVRAQWQPAAGPLRTRWAAALTPENAHREYPRPQMVRPRWTNLNGLWDYAIGPAGGERPERWEGSILVPFALESQLSGVRKALAPTQRLWYRRTFERPDLPGGGKLLLHFGAVDWHAVVWVNGRRVGEHRGGYDAFTFDITAALEPSGDQELVVAVEDPTDSGYQPCGKQVLAPRGIWYTAVSGIWQTVWLEPVARTYIGRLHLTPDLDAGVLRVAAEIEGRREGSEVELWAEARAGGRLVVRAQQRFPAELELRLPAARTWSPDDPFLYDLRVGIRGAGEPDEVASYFGMRKIEVRRDASGTPRFFLNGQPLFHYGPLDQGWWPDGLYTAPSDEALRYDLEITKKLGFNMIRKHVKIEPARWYTHCDRLGLMVWQDLPSGDRRAPRRADDKREAARSAASIAQYERELEAMMEGLREHPCVVTWIPFNEGWGQFDTVRITAEVARRDPTRLVISASGWSDFGVGSAHDIHSYPGPAIPPLEEHRAAVLGEFGGLGLPLEGHTWQSEKNWGYRSFKSRADLQAAYLALQQKLLPLVHAGLAGAVYTQTTDVEIEVNGLMSYDREVLKMDAGALAAAHRRLYLPPPRLRTLVPTSEREPQAWRFTTEKPAGSWWQPQVEADSWKSAPGGFGRKGTPGARVRTPWESSDIWLRRSFVLRGDPPAKAYLRLHHDEDAQIYLDGTLIARAPGYTTGYVLVPISDPAALRPGRHLLAVHCHQSQGGQYIDVGLVEALAQDSR